MNPGVIEEVGQTTRTFLQAIKDPLVLALCAMNLSLLGLFFYVVSTATAVRHAEMERIFAAQAETNKLLFQCVPSSGFKLQSDESRPAEAPLLQPRPPEAQ